MSISGYDITFCQSVRNLGVFVDETLSMDVHITSFPTAGKYLLHSVVSVVTVSALTNTVCKLQKQMQPLSESTVWMGHSSVIDYC